MFINARDHRRPFVTRLGQDDECVRSLEKSKEEPVQLIPNNTPEGHCADKDVKKTRTHVDVKKNVSYFKGFSNK